MKGHRKFTTSRDSDASHCSSRPSTGGASRSAVPINDRAYQSAALRTVNAYLSSVHPSQLHLRAPLPSARDITEALRFLLSRLDFPTTKLDDDVPLLLKTLGCPLKLNKSALKAPGTPHSWPPLLAVLHWLVQISLYNDHLSSHPPRFYSPDNDIVRHAVDSYSYFINGDDDSVQALAQDFLQQFDSKIEDAAQNNRVLETEVEDLEHKLQSIRSAPSAREVLEKEKSALLEDSRKFHAVVDSFSSKVGALEKGLEEKEKELRAKLEETKRISEENEELKKRIESQTVNVRDVERMKKEIQAVENDVAEAEAARNGWEEKAWDLEVNLGHKIKEIEGLAHECNQAIRRLKLANDFQYTLNPKGSSPAEIMGVDYKSTLKLALTNFSEDIKKSSKAKLEELIYLQQQSQENTTKLEAKKVRLTALQSRIDEAEAQLSLLKKDIQDHASKCAEEAEKLRDDVERKTHHLGIMERDAEEILKNSKLKLQDAIKQNEEEIQICAHELLVLVDRVSKYREFMDSLAFEAKTHLSETVRAIAQVYKPF